MYNWIIERYDDRDWLWWEFARWEQKCPHNLTLEYNQNIDPHKRDCTVYWNIGQGGCNMWENIPETYVRQKWNEARELGLIIEGKGWFFDTVTSQVRKRLTADYKEVLQYQAPVWWDIFREALKNWWSCAIGIRYSNEMKTDKEYNGELNQPKYPFSWGHMAYLRLNGDKVEIVDSYKWSHRHNTYTVEKFEELVANNQFFYNVYFIIPKPMTHQLPEHIGWATADEKQIVIERERLLDIAMENENKPLFNNYTDSQALTKMLIEIALIRKWS